MSKSWKNSVKEDYLGFQRVSYGEYAEEHHRHQVEKRMKNALRSKRIEDILELEEDEYEEE